MPINIDEDGVVLDDTHLFENPDEMHENAINQLSNEVYCHICNRVIPNDVAYCEIFDGSCINKLEEL